MILGAKVRVASNWYPCEVSKVNSATPLIADDSQMSFYHLLMIYGLRSRWLTEILAWRRLCVSVSEIHGSGKGGLLTSFKIQVA
jgi:hypothetical protein